MGAARRKSSERSCRHLYVIGVEDKHLAIGMPVKIGIANDPEERCLSLVSGSPISLSIYGSWRIPESAMVTARAIEALCHAEFASRHSHGEWFYVSMVDVMRFVKKLTYIYIRGEKRGRGVHPSFVYTPPRSIRRLGNNSAKGVNVAPKLLRPQARAEPQLKPVAVKRRPNSPVDADVARLLASA